VLDAGELGNRRRPGRLEGRRDRREEQEVLLRHRRGDGGQPAERLFQRVAGRQGPDGHKKGETVEVALPNGKKRKLKITKISVGVR